MKIKNDNRGSTLLFVLTAIAFIGLLGVAAMSATIINISMRKIEGETKKNFYDTDNVIEQIRAGLINLSSEASGAAYQEVLEQYATICEDGTKTAQEEFDNCYIRNMLDKLSDGMSSFDGTTYNYDVTKMEQLLNESERNAFLKREILDKGENKLEVHKKERYIVLRNVRVEQEKNTFSTRIKTDIRMEIPELKIENGGIYPEYTNYAILADNKVKLDGAWAVNVDGNVYAGTKERTDYGDLSKRQAGIELNGGSLKIIADYLISRGDILLLGDSRLRIGDKTANQVCNVWVENISTDENSNHSILEINGSCNVEDDLEINGKNNSVYLSGEYYGYHCKKNYLPDEGSSWLNNNIDKNSEYNSAISLNGTNSTLNMEQLSVLELAGRAFISRYGTESEKNKDIMLGESVSVRSNQIAYFVPEDFIQRNVDGTYQLDYAKYEEYLSFSVKEYINQEQSVIPYYLKRSSGEECYYYLNFKNEALAEKFYEKFYRYKSHTISSGADPYMTKEGIRLADGKQALLLSGAVLYKEKDGQNVGIKLSNDELKPTLLRYAVRKGREYKSRQLGLIGTLPEASKGEVRLEDKAKLPLFERIVDVDKLKNDAALWERNQKTGAIYKDGILYGNVILADGDINWDSDMRRQYGTDDDGNMLPCIVVATGDISVSDDFEGLLLSGRDVFLKSGGISVTANPQKIKQLLEADTTKIIVSYLKEYKVSENSSEQINYSKYVSYENWKKNKD